MSERFDRLIEILTSDKAKLIDLAEVAGCDPTTFYRGCNLSGVDLRGQDLSSMSFEGAVLENIQINEETKFSPETQLRVPLSFNLMRAGFEAVERSATRELHFELFELLVMSAGLPRRANYTPIKDTSPLATYKRQLGLRVLKCMTGIARNLAGTSLVVSATKLQVWKKKKILVETWEVLAFLNHMLGTRVTLNQMDWAGLYKWRDRFIREARRPVRKNQLLYDDVELVIGDPYAELKTSAELMPGGFVLIGQEPQFLQIEALVWGLYRFHKNEITEDQLDGLTRSYHDYLRETFPDEMMPPEGRGVSF